MTAEGSAPSGSLNQPFFVVGVANCTDTSLHPLETTIDDFLQGIVHQVGTKGSRRNNFYNFSLTT